MTKEKVKLELCWTGKQAALQEAFTPCTKKLIPCPDESINFNETENMFIEGDNLDALKLLMEKYAGKVKMIYIDPPYNTGNKLCYKDNFRMKLSKGADNLERSGCLHTNWLNMMYPRLYLARNLLRDDGVIFISIDDNEVHNLRKICDDIFGEENFVETLIWKKRATPPNDRNIGRIHEFILCYSKNINGLKLGLLVRDENSIARYTNPDKDSRGTWVASDLSANGKGGRLVQSCIYPITNPNNGKQYLPSEGRCWLFNKEKTIELIREGRIDFRENTGAPFLKRYLTEVRNGLTLPTILTEYGYSSTSSAEADKIFGKKGIFEYTKPTTLIYPLIKIGIPNKDNDLILDFFSGSSTTAHAVMQLNAEDGGNRKFIMVQLPEQTDENSEAFKAGYKTIADIGKERIRRVINKLNEDDAGKFDFGCKQDRGLKVFKIG